MDSGRETVLVDARNVLRSRWPNIPAGRVVDLCRAWAASEGVDVVVVFDGSAPGGLVGERRLDERALVVGTGRESADDRLIRMAGSLRSEGRPFALVTSDRALRAAAAPGATRVVGGGAFAGELLELPRCLRFAAPTPKIGMCFAPSDSSAIRFAPARRTRKCGGRPRR